MATSKYPTFEAVYTVGELRDALNMLPDDMPLAESDGIKLVVFNALTEPILGLEDNDGTWDDD